MTLETSGLRTMITCEFCRGFSRLYMSGMSMPELEPTVEQPKVEAHSYASEEWQALGADGQAEVIHLRQAKTKKKQKKDEKKKRKAAQVESGKDEQGCDDGHDDDKHDSSEDQIWSSLVERGEEWTRSGMHGRRGLGWICSCVEVGVSVRKGRADCVLGVEACELEGQSSRFGFARGDVCLEAQMVYCCPRQVRRWRYVPFGRRGSRWRRDLWEQSLWGV